MIDEREHIRAAQSGDVQAFNDLVRAYQGMVYRTAYRIVGESEGAADVAQETFVSAFKNIRQFRGGSFKSWLIRIAINGCYSQLRAPANRRVVSFDAVLPETEEEPAFLHSKPEEGPQERSEQHELGAFIQAGIESLPEEQRLTLVLSDIDGFRYDEIAEITGTNIGTVKSRLSRARAQMREYLLGRESVVPQKYQRIARHRGEDSLPYPQLSAL